MDGATLTIIGTVLAVGLALAGLIMRSTARLDEDRRAFQTEAAADRRAWQTTMDTFRTEMQRLAERHASEMRGLAQRQPHAEGRLDERGSAAD